MSRLNVLVYSGTGVSPSSLTQTLSSLRSLLSSSYDVQLITPSALLSSPWSPTCALLVFPGGRDLPYVHDLAGLANTKIKSYLEHEGGAYLGLCAGAYYACEKVVFEEGREGMEIVGERELGFFRGTGKGCAFGGFQYGTEEGAREVRVRLERKVWGEEIWRELREEEEEEDRVVKVWYNGGGVFEPRIPLREGDESIEVLGRYDELEGKPIAGVKCKVGKGIAVLWAVHPEHALLPPSPSSTPSKALLDRRLREEERRMVLLRATLIKMGLDVASAPAAPPQLLPLFLASANPSIVSTIYQAMQGKMNEDKEIFVDRHDSFHLKVLDQSTEDLVKDARSSRGISDADALRLFTKTMVACLDGAVPHRQLTPLFDFESYFAELLKRRDASEMEVDSKDGAVDGFGETILYGETVTSTQTLLDKNDALLALLPQGLIFPASHQLAGRGRGNNTWLSPAGCLQFSLLLRLPLSHSPSIVFVQYLFGVAVVEAIRNEKGYENVGRRVRLKWPNDIYADLSREPSQKRGTEQQEGERWKKIGGILVNSSFMNNEFSLIIGCGINNTNSKPTTCLSDLIALQNSLSSNLSPIEPLSPERLLAAILKQFEKMWKVFIVDGFEPFLDTYLERWIHSNQIITIASNTLTSRSPSSNIPQMVKVVAITPDYGLLRTIQVDVDRNGREVFGGSGSKREFIDLQPDGNSFDMLAGLIKTKTT